MDLELNLKSQDLIFIETTGFSMWPFLKTKERVVVKKVAVENLRVGNIILYYSNNQMICHRLVKKVASISGYLLYTRGDASLHLGGEPITEKALVGKVTGILRKGRIINFTGRRYSFVNRLIVEFAPFFRIGIKVIKRPIIYARSLVRRHITPPQADTPKIRRPTLEN